MRGVVTNISRLPLLLLLFVSLTLVSCAPNTGILGGGNWQQSGLANQHIRTLAVDSNSTQNIYAGSAGGGVFASVDGGLHWSERDNGLPFPDAINQLAFDSTGKKLYAATASGLFLSSDGAQHWGPVPGAAGAFHSQNLVALAFDLNNPHAIYAATSASVYASTNDGIGWQAVGSALAAGATINELTYDSIKHQLWAATSTGIYRYSGSGSRWKLLNNGTPNGIQVFVIQPAEISGGDPNLVFAGTSQGFLISRDNGAHWAQSQQSLQHTEVHSIFVDFQQPTTVYAGTTGAGVIQSNDSGQTWNGLGPDFPYGQPVYAIQLGADSFSQLFAAANAVYYFPGNSGGISFTRLLPLLIIFVFFFALIRFTSNRRRVNAIRANQQRTGQQAAPAEPIREEQPAEQAPAHDQMKDADNPL